MEKKLKLHKKCLVCKKEFFVYPYRHKTAKYCSRICTYKEHGKKISGERNYLWKGGQRNNSDIRNSTEYKKWRMNIFIRDDYTCQMCGKRGGIIQANHIKKFSDYPNLRFTLSNGITLCKPCHKKITWHEEAWEKYLNSNLFFRGIIYG